MRDNLDIGGSPIEEKCIMVDTKRDYLGVMRQECRVYMKQLKRMYPDVEFTIRSNCHDFGAYYEVCAVFDPYDEQEAERAFEVEAGEPLRWDEPALRELDAIPDYWAQVS